MTTKTAQPKYGIMSILPAVDPSQFSDFDILYNMVGQNTGNLLFTNAVWGLLGGEKIRVNYTFDPNMLNEQCDSLVIPAANWLNAHVDFGFIADLIEQLEIPVVIIGLGAQDVAYSGKVVVPDGTRRFVKAASERSASLSVRGHYTAEILNTLGVKNVTVTGCPSLYFNFREFDPPTRIKPDISKALLHSTRFSASHIAFAKNASIHREIFRFAFQNQLDLLLQSEPEEMAIKMGNGYEENVTEALKDNLSQIYDANDWGVLQAYLSQHCRLFFNIDDWSSAMDEYQFALGTRLHGTIMALNSGLPALLVHHDSRTKEICEFADIPSIDSDKLNLEIPEIQRVVEAIDFDTYYAKRRSNLSIIEGFFEDNNLQLNAQNL